VLTLAQPRTDDALRGLQVPEPAGADPNSSQPSRLDKLQAEATPHKSIYVELNINRRSQLRAPRSSRNLGALRTHRYERKSIAITANTPFSQWCDVFVDPAMTLAAIDRLVHHATILEMSTESYPRRSAERTQTRQSAKK
jgi:hypothetical protein